MKRVNFWKVLGCAAVLLVGADLYLRTIGKAAEPPPKKPAAEKQTSYVRFAQKFELPEPGGKTLTKLKIGDKLPPLTCKDLDGKPLDVDALYGEKATLVVCWSTWCGSCMAELPHEVRLAQAFKDLGLKVIGVNADEEIDRAKGAMSALGISWPTIYEPRGEDSAEGIVKTIGVDSWPTVLLFGADRRLISASPDLNSITVMDAGAGDAYAVRFLDMRLIKVLGPLPFTQYISPVN